MVISHTVHKMDRAKGPKVLICMNFIQVYEKSPFLYRTQAKKRILKNPKKGNFAKQAPSYDKTIKILFNNIK